MLDWNLKIIEGKQTEEKIEVTVVGLIDLLEEGVFSVDRIILDRERGEVEYEGKWQPSPDEGRVKATIVARIPDEVAQNLDITCSEVFPALPWEDWQIEPAE